MPVAYTLSDAVLEITFEGCHTPAESLAAIEQGIASIPPGTRPCILFDATRSRELRSREYFESLAAFLGSRTDSICARVATLVAHQVRFGLARQFGSLLEIYGVEASPFLDRATALTWLLAPPCTEV